MAQKEHIDPALMPMTRISNSAIDGVAVQMQAVREEIAKYAASDLVCYRAEEPEGLVAAQKRGLGSGAGAFSCAARGAFRARSRDHLR